MKLSEEDLQKLRKLRNDVRYANLICDPIEFLNRQKNLVAKICEFLLEPLEEYELKDSLSTQQTSEDVPSPS